MRASGTRRQDPAATPRLPDERVHHRARARHTQAPKAQQLFPILPPGADAPAPITCAWVNQASSPAEKIARAELLCKVIGEYYEAHAIVVRTTIFNAKSLGKQGELPSIKSTRKHIKKLARLAVTDKEKQETLYLKGCLLYSINESRDALALFKALGPDSIFYGNTILPTARIYEKLKMADEGLVFLAEASKNIPTYPRYILLECRARFLYIKGDPASLKEALRTGIEAIENAERAKRVQVIAHIRKKLLPSIQAKLDQLEPPPPTWEKSFETVWADLQKRQRTELSAIDPALSDLFIAPIAVQNRSTLSEKEVLGRRKIVLAALTQLAAKTPAMLRKDFSSAHPALDKLLSSQRAFPMAFGTALPWAIALSRLIDQG